MNRLDLNKATRKEVEAEIERLEVALANGIVWPRQKKFYLHSNKEDGYHFAAEVGLDEEATRAAAYMFYEVSFDVEVHQDGTMYATHFEGVELKSKVKV